MQVWQFFLVCIGVVAVNFAALAVPPTIADPEFDASVRKPRFKSGEGPTVLIDAGHRNFHSAAGRYKPVADVLGLDGFRVASHEGKFTRDSLKRADVLIIASAVGDVDPSNPEKWRLPVPSAFSETEIEHVAEWVNGGGALLLVVDYMPVAGMSADLAAAFGVHVADGYAYDHNGENKIVYTKGSGSLRRHPITRKRRGQQAIDRVHTFAGTALLVPVGAEPLLVFGAGSYLVVPSSIPPPDTPPPEGSPRRSIEGWSQGAVMAVGEGRLAVFGEAAIFSAQRYPNGTVMGMNHPNAKENKRFLVNVVRWLSRTL